MLRRERQAWAETARRREPLALPKLGLAFLFLSGGVLLGLQGLLL